MREALHRFLVRLLACAIGMEKQQINIGVREEPASSEASRCHEGEARGSVFSGGHDIPPKPLENVFDEPRPLRYRGAAVSCSREAVRNSRRLLGQRTPQFTDQ